MDLLNQVSGLEKIKYFAVGKNQFDLTQLPQNLITTILFGGERWSCISDVIVAKIGDELVGLVSFAKDGEANSGQPIIVGVYVLKKYRKRGIATKLLFETIQRAEEQHLCYLENPIRIDTFSTALEKAIAKLPDDKKILLGVHSQGNFLDEIEG